MVTHFTICKERGLPDGISVVGEYALVNKARKGTALLVLIAGNKYHGPACYLIADYVKRFR